MENVNVNIRMNEEFEVSEGCKSGVYSIYLREGEEISEENDRCLYVGKSINISKRRSDHLNSLRNNKHTNKGLQEEYNKYGEDRIYFRHMLVDRDLLKFAEKTMINLESVESDLTNINRVVNIDFRVRDPKVAKLHSEKMSKMMRGQNNPNAKLSEDDAKNIISMRDRGIDLDEIAEVYNIASAYVYRIGRDRWSYLN